MRLHRVITMVALVSAVALPAMASTAPLPTPQPGEESVFEIFNTLYGTSYTNNVDLYNDWAIPNYEEFSIPSGEILRIEAEVRYAGVVSEFGWYEPIGSDDPNYNGLFSVTQTGYVTGVSSLVDFDNDFGFFLNPAGEGAVWHSETALNWLREDHMVAYLTPDDTVILCWEDLPLVEGQGACTGSDNDYNDLIVELRFGVVPEPTSMLLLGLGIAGMVVRRFRTFA